MDTNMIYQALTFMMLGMGVVFAFLTIMIAVLKLQAYLIAKFVPTDTTVAMTLKQNQTKSNDTIAAITAAIFYHNNRRV